MIMKGLFLALAGATVALAGCTSSMATQQEGSMTQTAADTIYDFKMKDIDGKEVTLADFKGKVLLVVNVASKCGNTPQYEALEKLYEQEKDKGLVILGFPANEFGSQEPGTDADIKTFCTSNYN